MLMHFVPCDKMKCLKNYVRNTEISLEIDRWLRPNSKNKPQGTKVSIPVQFPIPDRPCIPDTRSNRFVERPCRRRVTEVDWNKSSQLFRNQANRNACQSAIWPEDVSFSENPYIKDRKKAYIKKKIFNELAL